MASIHALLDDASRKEAAKAVADVELQTSAEIVIAVRKACDAYWYSNLGWGTVGAFVALLLLLFLPHEFSLYVFPLDAAAAFAGFAWLSSKVPSMRRVFTRTLDRQARVRLAAKAAFVDMGVTRTSGRTGVLVFVGAFEGGAEVVADIGVPVEALGAPWRDAIAGMQRAVRGHGDPAAFFAAVRSLGPALATVLPRAADDVNELPDAMAVSE